MEEKESKISGREIKISRLFDAPIELVWEVWTDPEHIKNWWGPNGFTNTIQFMDLQPGGAFNLVMHGPDGTDYPNESIFKEVIRYKKIVYDHVSSPRILATIEFEAQGDKTLINWQMLFNSEEELIETVKKYNAAQGLKENIEKMGQYVQAQIAIRKQPKTNSIHTSGYAPVNGLKMYYEIHGSGEPLVLIHGGGSTIDVTFGMVLHLFAKTRKVIAVELQAHGRTSDRDAPETFQQDADDVAALLKYLDIEQADLFGFSNGGSTTLEIALRHPQLPRKIIIASTAYKREGFLPQLFESLAHAQLKDMPQPLQDAYKKVAPDADGLIRMFEKDRDRMIGFKDRKDDDLGSINIPVLIICGDKDIVTTKHAIEMAALFPQGQLVILPGAHGAYIGELLARNEKSKLPEATVLLINEFLDEN